MKKEMLTSVFMLAALLNTSEVFGQKILEVQEFEQVIHKLADEQIVDVRTPGEFSKGYLEGAINIDVNGPDFKEHVAALDKKRPVMVYCLSGARSAKAAEYLKEQGFATVYHMKGGMIKWNAQKKPVVVKELSGRGMSMRDYETKVSSNKIVLVDFYAPWCAPCIKMAPDLDAIANEHKETLSFLKLDADENKALMEALKVEALPGLLLYKDGKKVWSHSGFAEKTQIEQQIKKHQ